MNDRPGVMTRAWSSAVPGVHEVFHAEVAEHAYPPHAHATWTLFLVDDGAIRYDVGGRANLALPGMVSLLPPHVVHDGRPADSRGYRMRVIYLDADVIGEGRTGAAVDRPQVGGVGLRNEVSDLHHALLCADDTLEAETRLAVVTERLRGTLGLRDAAGPDHRTDAAEQLRDILAASLLAPPTLAAAARRIGISPTQAARAFSRRFGIPPHAYVVGRRVEIARERILGGATLAEAAAASGFYDQAHMTRRFKRLLGVTPGRFAGHGESVHRH